MKMINVNDDLSHEFFNPINVTRIFANTADEAHILYICFTNDKFIGLTFETKELRDAEFKRILQEMAEV